MSNLTTNTLCRFLFWVRYDGSFFTEMSKGNTPHSIINLFNIAARNSLKVKENDQFFSYPTSRYIILKTSNK